MHNITNEAQKLWRSKSQRDKEERIFWNIWV